MSESEKASVLFVDDEPAVLRALKRTLDDEPYVVRTCSNPEDALQEIVENAPTVVVADYYMPEMNGPVFLRKVREIDGTIVRLVLTGKPDVSAVLDAVREGAIYRFLLKPWDEEELRQSIQQALEHNLLLSERNRLLDELDRHRQTIEALETSHPGISRLPERDPGTGAFVLSETDLPRRHD